jgi:hypothetical protein
VSPWPFSNFLNIQFNGFLFFTAGSRPVCPAIELIAPPKAGKAGFVIVAPLTAPIKRRLALISLL